MVLYILLVNKPNKKGKGEKIESEKPEYFIDHHESIHGQLRMVKHNMDEMGVRELNYLVSSGRRRRDGRFVT